MPRTNDCLQDTKLRSSSVTTVHVLCAGAVKHAFTTLVDRFERHTGHSTRCVFGAVGFLLDRFAAGENADLLIFNRPTMTQLALAGDVLPSSLVDLGQVGVGIAVRRGAPLPDVSTPAALRDTMLNARSICYGDPKKGDSSGCHFATVIEKLGVLRAMATKTELAPSGIVVAERVRDGHVEIGATQASVIVACEGIELAGLLPDKLQHLTTYTCGIVLNDDAGVVAVTQLTDYLRAGTSRRVFAEAGFRPAAG